MIVRHFPRPCPPPGWPNLIIRARGRGVEYPEHEAPLSIKCVLAGREVHEVRGIRYVVDEDTYLLLNHGRRYSSHIERENETETFSFFFERDFAEQALRSLLEPADRLLDEPEVGARQPVRFVESLYPRDAALTRLLEDIRSQSDTGQPDETWLDERLHALLAHLLSRHAALLRRIEALSAVRRSTRLEQYRRVRRARDFIDANIADNHSLAAVARIACLSPHRLAEEYSARHDFEKVLEIFEDEIDGLTTEVPHYSWRLIGDSVPYYLETGGLSRERLRSRLEEHRVRFADMKQRVEHPGRKDLFAGLEARMEAAALHLSLVGEPAPDFGLLKAFNADPSLTLAALRGQVVLIDFWATWCAPCMAAWPSLRALRERWKDRGFEILSITSLQGGIGAEKGLTPEREIELTEKFIRENAVDWPVLFSNRSVNDPEYGAATLPSYVLIDRSGRIDRFFVGKLGALGEAAIERLVAGGGGEADDGR